MRTLVFGDIHGCFNALTTVVKAAGITDQDKLVFLGDYIDRGPDSRKVIDWLVERQARQTVVALRGNHEIMMLKAADGGMVCDNWYCFGGDTTLKSYGTKCEPGWEEAIPERHWDFLNQTEPWHESSTHIYVHAILDPNRDLVEQSDAALYWLKFDEAAPHKSGKPFICGHTVQRQGVPTNLGFAICIDTGVYKGMWLTCLDPEAGRFWQGNEEGVQREGRLAPALV